MTFERVRRILCKNDGSLPDLTFEFGGAAVVDVAYARVRARAAALVSIEAKYWSTTRNEARSITFADNPAAELLAGAAEPFHVVFGGLRSAAGAPIPDLGVFVLDRDCIALDYRMGPDWDDAAILGLFEIMRDLHGLAPAVRIAHDGNVYDDGDILLGAYRDWLRNHSTGDRMEPVPVTPPELLPVLDELRALEPLFHRGHDAARIAAPTFWEVGASGRRYGRQYVLDVLRDRAAAPAPDDWHADDFHLAPAGTDHYLLTYTLHQGGRTTRRLTVWRRGATGWEAVYHQGTVVA